MTSGSTNPERKLVNEDRWSRTYQVGPHEVYESKFAAGTVSISFRDLTGEWTNWTDNERLEFVLAFRAKTQLDSEDEKILEFLLNQQDEHIRVNLAVCLTRHSNKELAFQFLLRQARSVDKDRRSFFQGLTLLGDKRAIPTIRDFYSKYVALVQDANAKLDDDTRDLLMSCVALWKLTGALEYFFQLQSFQNHPNSDVSKQATLLLSIWQPKAE